MDLEEFSEEVLALHPELTPPLRREARFSIKVLDLCGQLRSAEDVEFDSNRVVINYEGKRVLVVMMKKPPIQIWSRLIDASDIFVVASRELLGWITKEHVQEAPRIEKGKDYWHEVDPDALSPLRERNAQGIGGPFSSGRTHGARYWDNEFRAWRCFGCNQLEYFAADVELNDRLDEEFQRSRRDQTPPPESESERPESKPGLRSEPIIREQVGSRRNRTKSEGFFEVGSLFADESPGDGARGSQ